MGLDTGGFVISRSLVRSQRRTDPSMRRMDYTFKRAGPPNLRIDSSGQVRGELPAAIVLHIDVLRADSKTWSAGHFHVAISGQHGRLAINADLHIAEVKGFVPGGALGNRGDVLRFGLGSAVGVRIGEIVGEQTLERRFILLDRGPRPADGDLADCFHRIVGEERSSKYGK